MAVFELSLEVLEDRTMPSLDFSILPPEINSGLMFSGAGSGPMLAAAAAWNGLAAELQAAAISYEGVVRTLSSEEWLGPASQSMAQAVTSYAAWMSVTAARSEAAASQTQAASSAFEGAFAATVSPAVIAANRTLPASLVATNLFGQNTPAIAATEAHYAELWAEDVALMAVQAGAAPGPSTTGVVAAAADEVSTAVATLFSAHAAEYQALSSMAASFHQQFVQVLSAAGSAYAGEEAAIANATG